MSNRTYTRAEKIVALRNLIQEAAVEARAEREGWDAYKHAHKNPFAGDVFDGFQRTQTDCRKALAQAILHTDAATLLEEVIA